MFNLSPHYYLCQFPNCMHLSACIRRITSSSPPSNICIYKVTPAAACCFCVIVYYPAFHNRQPETILRGGCFAAAHIQRTHDNIYLRGQAVILFVTPLYQLIYNTNICLYFFFIKYTIFTIANHYVIDFTNTSDSCNFFRRCFFLLLFINHTICTNICSVQCVVCQ